MLTLHKTDKTVQIAKLVEGRRVTPVYWNPTQQETLMNSVHDIGTFNDAYFRDRFELSESQATDIFSGLAEERVLESNQAKYFKVKRHIRDSLLSTMDVSDTSGHFQIDFDKGNTEYSGHMLICSGTGGGKTYFAVQMILRNLKGPAAQKRHFVIVSSEWNEDSTLKPLKQEKYQQYVTGIDVSENSLKDSEWGTSDEFFENEVKLRVEHAPRGAVVLLDDATDCVCTGTWEFP